MELDKLRTRCCGCGSGGGWPRRTEFCVTLKAQHNVAAFIMLVMYNLLQPQSCQQVSKIKVVGAQVLERKICFYAGFYFTYCTCTVCLWLSGLRGDAALRLEDLDRVY